MKRAKRVAKTDVPSRVSSGGEVRDVLVVGGGPAGLSAALILGRCLRRVVLCDEGKPRNAVAPAVHGFLTRDGVRPRVLRALARRELERYGVELRDECVSTVERVRGGFRATLASGDTVGARKLVIATGVTDELPEVAGLRALYGRGVFHCPYCDAWEVRGEPLAVLGCGEEGAALAVEIAQWSDDVVLCTNGATLSARHRALLGEVRLEEAPILRLEGKRRLEAIVFEGGRRLARRGLFFVHCAKAAPALRELGETDERNVVRVGKLQETEEEGVWVAGDAARDVHFAIVAAAEGAKAAYAINEAFLEEELRARRRRRRAA